MFRSTTNKFHQTPTLYPSLITIGDDSRRAAYGAKSKSHEWMNTLEKLLIHIYSHHHHIYLQLLHNVSVKICAFKKHQKAKMSNAVGTQINQVIEGMGSTRMSIYIWRAKGGRIKCVSEKPEKSLIVYHRNGDPGGLKRFEFLPSADELSVCTRPDYMHF